MSQAMAFVLWEPVNDIIGVQ